jgi:chromate reductase, NAD(P)H dehydrogenase (quinone)
MSTTFDVAVFVGSLRRASFTRRIANALEEVAPRSLTLTIIEIGQLPMYNQDLEDAEPPAEWTEFRRLVKAADAVLFATPEYNRSVPGVLKNAIDVGSRPRSVNAWEGKPGAVISVTPGMISGFGANHHLRQSLVFLNVPTMQQPEAYIGNVATLLDDAGKLKNAGTREFLSAFMLAFANWIELIARD